MHYNIQRHLNASSRQVIVWPNIDKSQNSAHIMKGTKLIILHHGSLFQPMYLENVLDLPRSTTYR